MSHHMHHTSCEEKDTSLVLMSLVLMLSSSSTSSIVHPPSTSEIHCKIPSLFSGVRQSYFPLLHSVTSLSWFVPASDLTCFLATTVVATTVVTSSQTLLLFTVITSPLVSNRPSGCRKSSRAN